MGGYILIGNAFDLASPKLWITIIRGFNADSLMCRLNKVSVPTKYY